MKIKQPIDQEVLDLCLNAIDQAICDFKFAERAGGEGTNFKSSILILQEAQKKLLEEQKHQ